MTMNLGKSLNLWKILDGYNNINIITNQNSPEFFSAKQYSLLVHH